jgi:hypothetical protein
MGRQKGERVDGMIFSSYIVRKRKIMSKLVNQA